MEKMQHSPVVLENSASFLYFSSFTNSTYRNILNFFSVIPAQTVHYKLFPVQSHYLMPISYENFSLTRLQAQDLIFSHAMFVFVYLQYWFSPSLKILESKNVI